MKKFLFSLIAVGLAAVSFAQAPISYKKRPTLGVNFFMKDMKTAILIDKTSLSNVFANKQWAKLKDMSPGLGLTYYEGLTEHIDFMTNLGGSYVKYPFSSKSGITPPVDTKFLLESSASVNFKLLTDKYTVVPYLSLGLGASMYAGTYFAAYAPMGVGLQINLGEETYINTNFTYHAMVSGLSVNHLNYSIGIASPLKDRKAVPVVVAPPPPPTPSPAMLRPVIEKDTDGDGILDKNDKCPDVAGLPKYDGCPVPDTDGDGINDENDKCPTVKGLAKYNGCPVPDRDRDGINDEEDKCPDVPGVARYQGCPIPDRDKDGINDEEDKCPDEAGLKSNFGCPEIQSQLTELAKNVYFPTGGAIVTFKAYKPLTTVVNLLKKYPGASLSIEGYTDNTGKAAANKKLSQKRADGIKDYMIKQGIEAGRLTATGFGPEQPIASNKTEEGRAKNRRVEMKATYMK